MPQLVADLVRRNVNVIAATTTQAAIAAKATTTTVPIVFTTGGDPVQLGLVSSLSRPGGNITGHALMNVEVSPKRLEVMHQVVPAANKFGLLINPTDNALAEPVVRDVNTAAATLGTKLNIVRASNEAELATAFATLAELKADGLVIGTDPFFNNHSEKLAGLALRYRLPAIYQYQEFVAAGGLISYGGDLSESYLLAGVYTGRILKGEKPADLPVEQVTKVELVINLKTAKALGITFPISVLGRADEVIE